MFVYDNVGTLALERVEWTDDTTRATALTAQDGRYVKSGDATRLYLGTFRTTGTTGQTEDSKTKRYVWNYYNRVIKRLYLKYVANHDYNTATWRAFNNNASGASVFFVLGVAEDALTVSYDMVGTRDATTDGTLIGAMGYDSTSAPGGAEMYIPVTTGLAGSAILDIVSLAAGYHYVCGLEYSVVGATSPTFNTIWLSGAINC